MNEKTYEFGEFALDLKEKLLRKNGQTVSLQPKVFDLLVHFALHHGELVTRDELMKAVWKDTFVEETNLRFCIHALRKALGKNSQGKDYIETLPKRGYRFLVETPLKNAESDTEKNRTGDEIKTEEISIPPKTGSKSTALKKLVGVLTVILIFSGVGFGVWKIFFNQKAPQNITEFQSIAVLPFESAGDGQNDLQIGLADALITNLGKLKQLKVLPLASVRKYSRQSFNALTAGNEIGADAVLSGTYRFEGENARVTVNLSRVSDGETLWTETFAANRKNDLDLENSVALRTARLISLKIADIEDERSLKDINRNAEAVQNYLSARKIWRTGELNRRKEMIGLFEKTIELEPGWALAYASFAEALTASDQFNVDWEKVEQNAKKALELDNSLASPHIVLGEIYQWRDWNWKEAENEFRKAVTLAPENASARQKYSSLLRYQRRFAEADAQLSEAAKSEPFSPLLRSSFCELYYFDDKIDKALTECNYAKQIEPDFWRVPKLLYWIYIKRKMNAEVGELVLGKLPPAEKSAHPLTKAIAENDLRPYFRQGIEEMLKKPNVNPMSLASNYLLIGENEKAVDYLEIALKEKNRALPSANSDPVFDPVRADKRFVEIMKQVFLQT
ncbi:MAG: winged helix-turn-helix domain-containing protein [Pyrinomonadaceae bacterium]|nr:winged helix-turn-helix domain-containing protein [Pyrinomonadaceae bacterium]